MVTQGKYQLRTEEFQHHVGGKAIATAFDGSSRSQFGGKNGVEDKLKQ